MVTTRALEVHTLPEFHTEVLTRIERIAGEWDVRHGYQTDFYEPIQLAVISANMVPYGDSSWILNDPFPCTIYKDGNYGESRQIISIRFGDTGHLYHKTFPEIFRCIDCRFIEKLFKDHPTEQAIAFLLNINKNKLVDYGEISWENQVRNYKRYKTNRLLTNA